MLLNVISNSTGRFQQDKTTHHPAALVVPAVGWFQQDLERIGRLLRSTAKDDQFLPIREMQVGQIIPEGSK